MLSVANLALMVGGEMATRIGSGNISPEALLQIKEHFPQSEELLFVCMFGSFATKKVIAVSENLIKVFKSAKRAPMPTLELTNSDLDFAFFSHTGENKYGSLILRTKGGHRNSLDSFTEPDALEILKIVDIESAGEMAAKKEQRGRLLTEVAGFGMTGGGVKVFEGEVHVNGIARPIDATTVAEVVSNGQVLVTTRPTLTRMALLAPIPGSALIPGLALAKKRTHDSRMTEVVVAGLNWQATARVNPDDLGKATAVANRINAIANASSNMSAPSPVRSQQADSQVSPNNQKSLATELSSLNDLFQSGVLSEDEFNSAKAKILGT